MDGWTWTVVAVAESKTGLIAFQATSGPIKRQIQY